MNKKQTMLGGLPFILKKPSEIFEKVNGRWQLKVAGVANDYITRSHPFDIISTVYNKETKKLSKSVGGSFHDLSDDDKKAIVNAFSHKGSKGKKVNKFYLVSADYDEQLKDDRELRAWAGNDKLRKQYYYAYRNDDFKRMKELIKRMSGKSKSKK